MAKINEADYIAGKKSAWQGILRQAIGEVGGVRVQQARAVLELHEARVQAKLLCDRIGVEYDPELHLGDIIEKRIGWAFRDR